MPSAFLLLLKVVSKGSYNFPKIYFLSYVSVGDFVFSVSVLSIFNLGVNKRSGDLGSSLSLQFLLHSVPAGCANPDTHQRII